MTLPDMRQKEELRQELKNRVKNLSAKQRSDASQRACSLLRDQKKWREARNIFFYAATTDEINLLPLMQEALTSGKKVHLPRYVPTTGEYEAAQIICLEDCTPQKFGILEPQEKCSSFPMNQLDLLLVPGVGFDPLGNRLGKGRGFYDRLLVHAVGFKCGVAFDEQIVSKVPIASHDVRMNCILTPSRWLLMVA